MKDFGEFNITPQTKGLIGDKIGINQVLNMNIVVEKFLINPSNYKEKGPRLDLQLLFKGIRRVLFISSKGLIDMIKRVPEDGFPFRAKIVKDDSGLIVFTKSDD